MSQRLGEILMAHGAIDAGQLQTALAHQYRRGRPLGDALVDLRLCSSAQVLAALAAQAGLPPIDLEQEPLDASLAEAIPRAAAERYRAVPLRHDEVLGVLAVAIAAPASQAALEGLRSTSGVRRLQPFLATDQAIAQAISKIYAARAPAQPTILLYGWPEATGQKLVAGLGAQQIPARIATASETAAAGPRDVVLAPVPSMEALLMGRACRALLIAAAKRAEDFPRAEKLAACSFLLAPLDMDCVVRAVQRCHQLLGHRAQRAV
ncbi:MAG TPA: hypothetical protein VND93_18455 [Myxococcales bacterium]|jgi:type IV pilus assembly protein PilB|nr:hypothetical protein [Myxococcales bacterium]